MTIMRVKSIATLVVVSSAIIYCLYYTVLHEYADMKPTLRLKRDHRRHRARSLAQRRFVNTSGFYYRGSNKMCMDWIRDMTWIGQGAKPDPIFKLSPDHFLYPATVNGPSNEFIGFQEAIFIAIKTNRTIVAPTFMQHYQDKDSGKRRLVPPNLRVDLKRLSRLVSIVPSWKMQRECNHKFDIGFQAKKVGCGFEKYIRKTCGMSLSPGARNLSKNERYHPIKFRKKSRCRPPTLPITYVPPQPLSLEKVVKYYRTDLPCAIAINAYKVINQQNSSKIFREEKSVEKIFKKLSSNELLALISTYTERPRYIREIASKFISEIVGTERYIALHWRYNHEWKTSYCHPDRTTMKFCDKLSRVTASDVAKALWWLSDEVVTKQADETAFGPCTKKERVIGYLATPAKNYQEITDMSKDAATIGFQGSHCYDVTIYNKKDIETFLRTNYPADKCSFIWRDAHELISLIENEICHRSYIFAYSPSSSWSSVAVRNRMRNKNISMTINVWKLFRNFNKTDSGLSVNK